MAGRDPRVVLHRSASTVGKVEVDDGVGDRRRVEAATWTARVRPVPERGIAVPSDDDEYRIAHIPDKGDKDRTFDTGGAAAAYTGVGRYAFGHELWSAIDEVASVLPAEVELDDIPVMQLLLHRGQLTGCLVREHFFDVGLPSGYAEAAALHTVA